MATIILQSKANWLKQINMVLIFRLPRAQTLGFCQERDVQHKY